MRLTEMRRIAIEAAVDALNNLGAVVMGCPPDTAGVVRDRLREERPLFAAKGLRDATGAPVAEAIARVEAYRDVLRAIAL